MASVITMQPTANNVPESASPEAVPLDIDSEEEKKKKKQDDELSEIVEDCCCYYGQESFILLRCISEICQCMATCTEQCCDSCGDCLQNSCEGCGDFIQLCMCLNLLECLNGCNFWS